MFTELCDKKIWEKVRTSDDYDMVKKLLKAGYDKYCADEAFSLPLFFDEYLYWKNGNRFAYEDKYFTRRAQLAIYAAYTLLYPENEQYLNRLENVIYMICHEHDWSLPAHRTENWIDEYDTIDLFSSETAFYLAEIKYILHDKLNPLICRLISNELDRRIFTSFENKHWFFEDLIENWSSVCAGSIGAAYLYEAPGRFSKVRNRIENSMNNFLRSIPEDGSCSEGVAYWNYGFSFYLVYYDLLRRFSGEDYAFGNEKIKKFARFFNSMLLDSSNTVSFADSDRHSTFTLWMPFFLNSEYKIPVPPVNLGVMTFGKPSFLLREIIYFDSAKVGKGVELGKTHYEALQVYVERRENYCFALKGGHNDELHNHNDIGSFIVFLKGRQVLADLGWSEYTRQYFDPEVRYTLLNNSALGHSLPIINGKWQVEGEQYSGKLTVDGNKMTVDLKNAYPLNIEHFKRSFTLEEDSILLSDSFDSELKVTERFVTDVEPMPECGKIVLGDAELIYDDSAYSVSVKSEEMSEHGDICTLSYSNGKIIEYDKANKRKVYLIDFDVAKGSDCFEMMIKFN